LVLCFLCVNAWAEQQFPFLGTITEDNVNVRSGQDISFEKLGQLKNGQDVVVVEKSYDWYRIKLPDGSLAYISDKFVRTTIADVGVVAGNHVNVRAGAGEKFNVIGRLDRDTKVKVQARESGWCKIEPMEGIYGWVSANFVAFKSADIPAPKVIAEPPRSIYPRPKPESEKPKEPELFIAVGQIQDLGRHLPAKDLRYKLTVDNKTVYYLRGAKEVIDPFVKRKVKLQGNVTPDPTRQFTYPIISVVKIELAP